MKEYIQKLKEISVNDFSVRLPDAKEMMEKINELIDYLNSEISVGLFPIPDGYKEDN